MPRSFTRWSTKKSWSEIPGHDSGRQVEKGPAAGGAAGNRSQHLFDVEADPVSVNEAFGNGHHVAGDQDLIDHLCVLSGARTALMDDRAAHGFEARPDRLQYLGRPSHHDREGAARAPMSPPDTGASRVSTSRRDAASAISTASDGSLVVMSTMTVPG